MKAAAAGGSAYRSINSNRSVFETAPIIPAAAARRNGLLNMAENPNTPQKPVAMRKKIRCHNARCKGKNAIGFSPSSMASIHAVMVATVMMISEYMSRSVPERISSFARSIPLVINGNPGMINSIEQI